MFGDDLRVYCAKDRFCKWTRLDANVAAIYVVVAYLCSGNLLNMHVELLTLDDFFVSGIGSRLVSCM